MWEEGKMATDSSGNDQIERKLIGIGNEIFSTGALGEGNPITHARIRTTPHTARKKMVTISMKWDTHNRIMG